MRLFLAGAGGHAREILDIVETLAATGGDLTIAGIYADGGGDLDLLAARGHEFSGSLSRLPAPGPDDRAVIGIGSSAARQRVEATLKETGWQFATIVHPDATVGSSVDMGSGCVIFAGARISSSVALGRHVHVNHNATVGHDARLGDFVSVNPLAAVSGRTTIGRAATIGSGACVLERLSVADEVTVGSGAVVTRDVARGLTVVGVPARPMDPL